MSDVRDELLKSVSFEKSQPRLFSAEDDPLDWQRQWKQMPEFLMGDTQPVQKITVQFKTQADRQRFSELLGIPTTDTTNSIWYPAEDWVAPKNYVWDEQQRTYPKYPIYIPSLGRYDLGSCTATALDSLGLLYKIVVEPFECEPVDVDVPLPLE